MIKYYSLKRIKVVYIYIRKNQVRLNQWLKSRWNPNKRWLNCRAKSQFHWHFILFPVDLAITSDKKKGKAKKESIDRERLVIGWNIQKSLFLYRSQMQNRLDTPMHRESPKVHYCGAASNYFPTRTKLTLLSVCYIPAELYLLSLLFFLYSWIDEKKF